MSKSNVYTVRPHHLLCTLAFEGKGYNLDFVKNYQRYVEDLNQNPHTLLHIKPHTDVICSACPHKSGLSCQSEEKVQGLDKRHAEALDLKIGDYISWQAAKARLAERAPQRLNALCAGCEWLEMDICVNALKKLRESKRFKIWNQLKSVTQIHKKAVFRLGGFSDQLTGTVTLLNQSDTAYTLQEKGIWIEKQITAMNHYIWQLEDNGLSLYRQQQEVRIRLCHFTEDNHWVDTHLCGQDSYHGTLTLQPQGFNLTWVITGPKKDGQIECCYTF